MYKNIAVIGASGTIGTEFLKQLTILYPDAIVNGFTRDRKDILQNHNINVIDYLDEKSIESAAINNSITLPYDLVIIANGILHNNVIKPEKSINQLLINNLEQIYLVNTIIPTMIAKHFLPRMSKTHPSVLIILSAKIGSISDNRLGGWYSYRASKAALNMMIKNFSIEMRRSNENLIIAGLHPGTVDSPLSKPFQKNILESKLFSPEYAVERLITVINNLTIKSTGKCFSWNGDEILP